MKKARLKDILSIFDIYKVEHTQMYLGANFNVYKCYCVKDLKDNLYLRNALVHKYFNIHTMGLNNNVIVVVNSLVGGNK